MSRRIILDGLFRVKVPCNRETEEDDGRVKESTVSNERGLGGSEGTSGESKGIGKRGSQTGLGWCEGGQKICMDGCVHSEIPKMNILKFPNWIDFVYLM